MPALGAFNVNERICEHWLHRGGPMQGLLFFKDDDRMLVMWLNFKHWMLIYVL
jgi:hypothetical protein